MSDGRKQVSVKVEIFVFSTRGVLLKNAMDFIKAHGMPQDHDDHDEGDGDNDPRTTHDGNDDRRDDGGDDKGCDLETQQD